MALAIAAGVITTAVIAYQAATQASSRAKSYGAVQLPENVLFNFYALSGYYVDTYFAPNYGRVAQAEVVFDPNVHEAVMHDEGEADEGPVVVEVLRTGYLWHQRTLRAAMVRVRG